MDEQEPGWESSGRFPRFSGILPEDYVSADASASRGFLHNFGLSPERAYKVLGVMADSLTGNPELSIENDAGEIISYPADFFKKAPAQKAVMQRFPRRGWMDGGMDSPGGKYERIAGVSGSPYTEERPDTKAYGKRDFNPNDYHAPPIAQAFDSDILGKTDHKASWKANARNLAAFNGERMFIYGFSKEATAKDTLDPELMRYAGITSGGTYRVVGYVGRFKGERGVTIVNDEGKEMTYRASIFRQ